MLRITLVFCLAFFVQGVNGGSKAATCPEDWQFFDGTCYREFEDLNLNWFEAAAECQRAGARLASVHSVKENEFLTNLAAKGTEYQGPGRKRWVGVPSQTWIGMLFDPVEKRWRWTDGSPVDYKNWGREEPQLSDSEEESCAELLVDEPTWENAAEAKSWHKKWNGIPCETNMRSFICQKTARWGV